MRAFISASSAVTWLFLNATRNIHNTVKNATYMSKNTMIGLLLSPVKVKTSAQSSNQTIQITPTTQSTGNAINANILMTSE